MSRSRWSREPRLVEVVAVEVGDVQVVGVLDRARRSARRELVVAGERRTTSRRTRARTTGRRGSSRAPVSIRIPAWPSEVARILVCPSGSARSGRSRRTGRPGSATGQATGGSVNCWPARDTCSVHACRPSSAARNDRPGRRTSRRAPTVWPAAPVGSGWLGGGGGGAPRRAAVVGRRRAPRGAGGARRRRAAPPCRLAHRWRRCRRRRRCRPQPPSSARAVSDTPVSGAALSDAVRLT